MAIDWITVSAQVVNFLVLVYLLKRFLYGPIVTAMDRREQRITDRLREAREREDKAQTAADDYHKRREHLEREREERLREAREAAEKERKRLAEEARREIDGMKEQWRKELEQEKSDFLDALRREAAQGVTQIARRVLRDLAERALEHEIIRVFLKRLEGLDEETLENLQDPDGPVRVLSTFELADADRRDIRKTLKARLPSLERVDFERSEDLVCGLALRIGQRKIDWSVDAYLDALDERLEEALKPGSQPSNRVAD